MAPSSSRTIRREQTPAPGFVRFHLPPGGWWTRTRWRRTWRPLSSSTGLTPRPMSRFGTRGQLAFWPPRPMPAFKDPYFQDSVAKLLKAFRGPSYVGPSGYASEKNSSLRPGDDQFDEDRNRAFAAVLAVIELLRANLW